MIFTLKSITENKPTQTMDSTFITVALIGLLAVMSPGPDFLIVTRNSLLYSKRIGLATALGIAVGNIWWIAASVLGISLIISQTVILFNILKWVGALYLIYLGVKSLLAKKRSLPQSSQVADVQKESTTPEQSLTATKAFMTGVLTNVLNPKCAMFFVSFFSIVITPDTSPLLQWAYGLEIMVIAVCWFSLVATVLSIQKVKSLFEGFSHWLDRVTGAILIALGIKVALFQQK
jgi:RhtB (resistance to homoserine/threonine) family protein